MTYPEISKSMISQFKISLLTLEEQIIIIEKINIFENDILKLKHAIEKLKLKKDFVLRKYL